MRDSHVGKGWYSFDLGAWHVVVLNSNCRFVGGCHEGSEQERWLRADLAASSANCTLAIWHHARFTSGTFHRSDPAVAPFWQALYEAAPSWCWRATSTSTSASAL